MKRYVFIIHCLACILVMASCSKSTCLNEGIQVTFRGFDSTRLTNIIVEQYKRNDSFSTLVSINISDTTDTLGQIYQNQDTIFSLPQTLAANLSLAAGYDYMIILPFEHRSYKISGITYHSANRHSSGSGGCTNDLTYYLDGTLHSFTGSSYNQRIPPPAVIVLNN